MNRINRGRKAAVLCLTAMLAAFPVLQAKAEEISENMSDAQQEKENLQSDLTQVQALIDSLEGSQNELTDNIAQLDAELTDIAGRIEELNLQLADKEAQISDTQNQLDLASQTVSRQYEDMKVRIRYMYENGSSGNYLELLFQAGSFADFLNKAVYIMELTQYDRNMLSEYQDNVEFIKGQEAALLQQREELTAMQQQVAEEQAAVSELMTAKEQELCVVDGSIQDAQAEADYYAAELEAQEQVIAQIQQAEEEEAARKAAEEEAAARKAAEEEARQAEEQAAEEKQESSNNRDEVTGAFSWPCPASHTISSDYGPRVSPTAGASSDHKGIDISAPSGSDIVAAAAGTVSYAGYSTGGGNYCIVSHGNGVSTVYMHASELLVATGDMVAQNQVIAQVGSTGISTGPHLHFAVTVDGSYVSPWNYVS